MASSLSIFLTERMKREIEREIALLNESGKTLHEAYGGDVHLCAKDYCPRVWGDVLQLHEAKKLWNPVRVARRARGYKFWHLPIWSMTND